LISEFMMEHGLNPPLVKINGLMVNREEAVSLRQTTREGAESAFRQFTTEPTERVEKGKPTQPPENKEAEITKKPTNLPPVPTWTVPARKDSGATAFAEAPPKVEEDFSELRRDQTERAEALRKVEEESREEF